MGMHSIGVSRRDCKRASGSSLAATFLAIFLAVASHTPQAKAQQNYDLVSPFGHADLIEAAAISEDGAWLFTGGNDGTVVFWHLKTRKSVARLKVPRGKISSLATNRNGSLVVVSASEKDGDRYESSAYVYSSDTFTEVGRVSYPDGYISGTAISDNGNLLATAEQPFRIAIANLQSGERLSKDLAGRPGDLRFIEDDNLLVMSEEGEGVQVRAVADLKMKRYKSLAQHQAPVTIYDPRSSLAYIFDLGSKPPTIRAYDGNITKAQGESFEIPDVQPTAIAAAPDFSSLAFGGFFGRVDIIGDGRPVVAFDAGIVDHGPEEVKLLSYVGPEEVLTVIRDGTVATRDARTGELLDTLNPVATFRSPQSAHLMGGGTSLVSVVSPDENAPASQSEITVTDLETRRVRTIRGYHVLPVPGDQTFLGISNLSDESVRVSLLGLNSDTPVSSFDLASPTIAEGDLSPAGDRLILADMQGGLTLYDAATGTVLQHYQPLSDGLSCLKFLPDGKRFLVCRGEGPALYAIDQEAPLWALDDALVPWARDGVYAAECDCLVMAGNGSIYEVGVDGEPRRMVTGVEDPLVRPGGQLVYSIIRAPSGRLLASAEDGRLFDLGFEADGFHSRELISNEGEPLRFLSLTPDGQFILGIGQGLSLFSSADFSTVAQLFEVPGNRWTLLASDGRFDTNDFSLLTDFVWSFPDQRRAPLAVELLAQPLFVPNLMLALTSGTPAPEVAIDTLSSQQLGVHLDAQLLDSQRALLTVTLDRLADGSVPPAHDLKVLMGGAVVARSEEPQWDASGAMTFTVQLPTHAAGETIGFSAYAFNDDRVKSRDAAASIVLDRAAGPLTPPRLWLVAIGVGDNGPANYRLSYPPLVTGQVADRFANLLGGSSREVVPITMISQRAKYGVAAPAGGVLPNKNNILATLDALAGKGPPPEGLYAWPRDASGQPQAAGPDDVVVVYYMGHSVVEGGLFSLIPYSAGEDPDKLSETELAAAVADLQAQATVLLLDTCYSGAVAKNEGFKPGPFSLPGLSQVIYDKSIIVAVAADATEQAQSLGKTPFAAAILKSDLFAAPPDKASLSLYLDAVEDEGARIAEQRGGALAASRPRYLRLDLGIIRRAEALLLDKL